MPPRCTLSSPWSSLQALQVDRKVAPSAGNCLRSSRSTHCEIWEQTFASSCPSWEDFRQTVGHWDILEMRLLCDCFDILLFGSHIPFLLMHLNQGFLKIVWHSSNLISTQIKKNEKRAKFSLPIAVDNPL